jgi:hypothetical protein
MRKTFREIVRDVWATVPARPAYDPCKLTYEEYAEQFNVYRDWQHLQSGWIRANGSQVGFPMVHGHPHGEKAACRANWERHIRTIPRHLKNHGFVRSGRDYGRLFTADPFSPEWMTYEPAPVLSTVKVHHAEIVRTMPVQSVCVARRAHARPTMAHFRVPVGISKPVVMWRPMPLRPPMKAVANA